METLILSLFGLSAVAVLGVSAARMLSRRGPRAAQAPRSEREIERDRQSAAVWLCVLAVVVGLAVLAYLFTR
ncbi:hypothetical protein [Brachybacterium hainanense]|uniref:Uncharacterized protein n=1 Tax=Brachybacterium hainanense TaxID=1541174 RepID=A0ABV6RB66_9MICO